MGYFKKKNIMCLKYKKITKNIQNFKIDGLLLTPTPQRYLQWNLTSSHFTHTHAHIHTDTYTYTLTDKAMRERILKDRSSHSGSNVLL